MSDTRPFAFPSTIGLSQSATGPDVKKLQEFLQRFGYLRISSVNEEFSAVRAAASPPETDLGNFDEATATALRNFQQFHGLPVTGALDEATVAQMSEPRCGFPDIPTQEGVSDFVAQGNRWDRTNLTYGFQEFSPDLTQQQVRDAITAALSLWSQVTPLRFAEVPLASNPDFVIRFVTGDHGDGSPFDGVGRVLAHAFYPPPNGGAIAGDAHFDEAETWTVNIPVPAGGFDLVTVAAHEFGHSLGLAHSSVAGALMFPSYSGPHRFLSQDDIDGIQSIYGSLIPGQLLFYRDTTQNGTGDVNTPSVIGQGGWDTFKFLFSGGNGIIYAVDQAGQLLFYRDTTQNGTGDVNTPSVIGQGGWDNFKFLFPGGNGIIYAVDQAGQLLFYRDTTQNGTSDVNTPSVIGQGGWDTFKFLFSGGNGIIYAVDQAGQLLYRDTTQNGTGDVNTPSVIGQGGWDNFKFLFPGGNGIVYAVVA